MQRKKIQIYGSKIMEDRVNKSLTRGQVHKAAAREQRKVSPRSGSNIENSSETDWFEEYTVESWCIGAGLDYRDYLVPSEQKSASESITVDISQAPNFGVVDTYFYAEYKDEIKQLLQDGTVEELKNNSDSELEDSAPHWPEVVRLFRRGIENSPDSHWFYDKKQKSARLKEGSIQDVLDLSRITAPHKYATYVDTHYLWGKPHFYNTDTDPVVIPMSVLWSIEPGLIVEPGAAAQVNAIEKGMLANQNLGQIGYPQGHFSKVLEGQSQIREALNILAREYRLKFHIAEIESSVIHRWPSGWQWWKNRGLREWFAPEIPDVETLESQVYSRNVLVLTSADTQAGSVTYLGSGPREKIKEEET